MKKMYALAMAAAVLAATGGAAMGDVVVLKDGRTFSGSVMRSGKMMLITTDAGKVESVLADDVKSVALVSNTTPAQAADAEWTRVAVLVKRSGDLQSIINLHQKFLDKFPDQPISASVKKSLAEYQLLSRQNGVKFRGRWMPAGQVDVTIREWAERARPALALYQSGRIREALAAANDVLDDDGQNPNALAVAGLASYRLNGLAKSRDYFSQMAIADPSSVLSENNLAVVFAQQKRDFEAMIHYTHAMQAMPSNRLVLDNIVEEIASFTGDVTAPPYTDMVRQFEQAETRIEGEMSKKGLFRFGATWVTAEQLEKIKTVQHDIETAMAQLDAQYQGQRLGGVQMDQALQETQKEYNDTVSAIAVLDSEIITARGRGGDVWFLLSRRDVLVNAADQLHKQLLSLQAQHDQAVAGLAGFYAQAEKLKAAQKQLDQSKYSGIQRIMEVGEDENPPSPTVVILPGKLPTIAQPAQPGGTIVIVHNNDEVGTGDTGVTTGLPGGGPFGFPGFPGFPHNGGGGHHGDGNGDGHGGHGGDGDGHGGHGGSGDGHGGGHTGGDGGGTSTGGSGGTGTGGGASGGHGSGSSTGSGTGGGGTHTSGGGSAGAALPSSGGVSGGGAIGGGYGGGSASWGSSSGHDGSDRDSKGK